MTNPKKIPMKSKCEPKFLMISNLDLNVENFATFTRTTHCKQFLQHYKMNMGTNHLKTLEISTKIIKNKTY